MLLNQSSLVSWFVIILIALSEMATDIYVPSLPQISSFFGISEGFSQLTISLNLLGIALSGLIYGPLSDIYGRRLVILIGFALFVVASLLCCFSNDILTLILFRFLQGVGAGVSLVVGLAAISDVYETAQCAKVLSRLGMVVALSPGIAPILGGFIASSYDWHMVFWVVAGSAAFLWALLVWKFPETRSLESSVVARPFKMMFTAYQRLLKNLRFVGYAFIHVITIFWLWADMANLPFLYIKGMNLPMQHYGYFMAFAVGLFMLGSTFNQRLVGKKGSITLLKFGLILPVISSLVLLLAHTAMELNPFWIQALKIPSSFGLAFILGNATTLTLEAAGPDRGAGSGMLGALQMACGAGGIALSGFWYDGTILPLAIICMLCAVSALFICFLLRQNVSASVL